LSVIIIYFKNYLSDFQKSFVICGECTNTRCSDSGIATLNPKKVRFPSPKQGEFRDMKDEELIQQLRREEEEAFSYMIETYSKLLWVVVGGILGSVGTAQDIEECISDVYIHVWKNPDMFNHEKGSLKTYLAVVAKSKALDAYRKLNKAKIIGLDETILSTDDDLLAYIMDKEMYKELYVAIDSLTEPNKEIVVRRYFFEEKPARIAKATSLPIKEVENRLYQSKQKLRKQLVCGGYEHD